MSVGPIAQKRTPKQDCFKPQLFSLKEFSLNVSVSVCLRVSVYDVCNSVCVRVPVCGFVYVCL